jgi:hypothetical protein
MDAPFNPSERERDVHRSSLSTVMANAGHEAAKNGQTERPPNASGVWSPYLFLQVD